DYIGVDVIQPDQRRVRVADSDYFVPFVAKDTLAHPLGVRAVIAQQDSAHCFAAGLGSFFFFEFFLLSFFAGVVVDPWLASFAAAAAAFSGVVAGVVGRVAGVWPSGFW